MYIFNLKKNPYFHLLFFLVQKGGGLSNMVRSKLKICTSRHLKEHQREQQKRKSSVKGRYDARSPFYPMMDSKDVHHTLEI